MDNIGGIVKLSFKIYEIVKTVKTNKKQCKRISNRVNALKELVESINTEPSGSATSVIETALNKLEQTLTSTHSFIATYSDSNYLNRFINSKNHLEEFSILNDQLTDCFQILSLSLQVEKKNDPMKKLFAQFENRQIVDKADRESDIEALKRDFKNYLEEQNTKFLNALKTMENSKITFECRLIDPKEITYENPENPFEKTETCEFYKGEFSRFPVAIKRYPKSMTSPTEVKKTFEEEVKTMRRFESPHILRLFGICIENNSCGSPVYSIVMEYCLMGPLRVVLNNEKIELTVMDKALMCLGAAHGIYRLHQTEEKTKVHGCLSSRSFMVAEGFTVKLSNFELSKTETSFLRNPKPKESSICYCAPELFKKGTSYNKASEIFSLGVVLWEIVTRSIPWNGLSKKEIEDKILKKQEQEEIAGDYPEVLKEIICDCRAYESSQRPTVLEVLDRLRNVVIMLENEKFLPS